MRQENKTLYQENKSSYQVNKIWRQENYSYVSGEQYLASGE